MAHSQKTSTAPKAGVTTSTATPANKTKAAAAPLKTPAGSRPAAKSARTSAAAKALKAVKQPKAARTASQPAAAKPAKLKKPKLVRDSFTIPKAEYAVLDELKQRAAKLARPAKKSELLRAGIKALAAMDEAAFAAALGDVPTLKTGRPSQA